jgi:methyl-accepting chemotaxis protein
MDEVTQQNSALVEQNAAAAKALEQQSQSMDERVSFFRVEEARGAEQAPARAVVALKRHATGVTRPPASADTRPEPGSSARAKRGSIASS